MRSGDRSPASIWTHRLTASIEAPAAPVIEVRRSAHERPVPEQNVVSSSALAEHRRLSHLDHRAAGDPAGVETGVGGVVGRHVLQVAGDGVQPQPAGRVDVAEAHRARAP